MVNGTEGRPTKNERRERARIQAKQQREKQQKREKRNRVFIQSGVVVTLLAIAAVVTLLIVNAVQPPGPGPANMASDGIVIGTDGANLTAVRTDALGPDENPIPSKPNRDKDPIDIVLYADYMCPGCGQFEQTNGTVIQNWVGSGEATLEIHPLAFLDRMSLGSKYSSRAANAVACVADTDPDKFFQLHNTLLSAAVQPAENTKGLTNDELLEQIKAAGVKVDAAMKSCVNDQQFGSWVTAATQRAGTGPLPNTELERVTTTPTVLVNGERYESGAFEDLLLKHVSETSDSAQ
ncbi:thioredoxin domain-containing protein [Klugiella xanthotipulae]|uniref:Protein-disulfide isomerase n=1 Tax=Klugiella xanthotipulae TaxID=244735 RepID=A0A543I4X3_9MICO|nr:thioredoxin domain-containing protein [Klugiella xanthotipulae]TQM65648.1 protein-disulfide isomerase [Klugiella xanthotipulae]